MKYTLPLIVLCLSVTLIGCDYGLSPRYSSEVLQAPEAEGERYNDLEENPFIAVADEPISTFSVDADGGSYSNSRRFLMKENTLPPSGAIRTEEFINYFPFDYPGPTGNHPIALNGEVSYCPWTPENKLIRIGIQGKDLTENPPANWVLLIDVSGSMGSSDKLGLLREAFSQFVDEMDEEDRIAIVTYAGADKVLLESTDGSNKSKIKRAIRKLKSGGSTAGAKGIITAYEIAEGAFIPGGNNRIILGTDGDFNVGPSSQEELIELIEEKRGRRCISDYHRRGYWQSE